MEGAIGSRRRFMVDAHGIVHQETEVAGGSDMRKGMRDAQPQMGGRQAATDRQAQFRDLRRQGFSTGAVCARWPKPCAEMSTKRWGMPNLAKS